MMAEDLPPFLRQALIGRIGPTKQEGANASSSSSSHSPTRQPPHILVPPLNFANVSVGISRSGHPNERNYEFLRRLELKTVLYVANEDYRPGMSAFCEQEGIKVLHCPISVNKEPFAIMEDEEVARALECLLDKRNHPILVHCNKGKYRVGCIIGILRRLQGWSYTSTFEEFARFAGTKAVDEEYIEAFDLSQVRIDSAHKPAWL